MIEQILHLSCEIDEKLRQDELATLKQIFREKKTFAGTGSLCSIFIPSLTNNLWTTDFPNKTRYSQFIYSEHTNENKILLNLSRKLR